MRPQNCAITRCRSRPFVSCADRSRCVGNSESSPRSAYVDADVGPLLAAARVDRAGQPPLPVQRLHPLVEVPTELQQVEELAQLVLRQAGAPVLRRHGLALHLRHVTPPRAGVCRRARGRPRPRPRTSEGCGWMSAATSAGTASQATVSIASEIEIRDVRAHHVHAERRPAVSARRSPSRTRPRRRCSPCPRPGSSGPRHRPRARARRPAPRSGRPTRSRASSRSPEGSACSRSPEPRSPAIRSATA